MFTFTETSTQQIFSVVSSAYVSERHGDEIHHYLPTIESESTFDEILAKLRSALSCCGVKGSVSRHSQT